MMRRHGSQWNHLRFAFLQLSSNGLSVTGVTRCELIIHWIAHSLLVNIQISMNEFTTMKCEMWANAVTGGSISRARVLQDPVAVLPFASATTGGNSVKETCCKHQVIKSRLPTHDKITICRVWDGPIYDLPYTYFI